jgi:hypothetical protein
MSIATWKFSDFLHIPHRQKILEPVIVVPVDETTEAVVDEPRTTGTWARRFAWLRRPDDPLPYESNSPEAHLRNESYRRNLEAMRRSEAMRYMTMRSVR